MNLRNYSTLHIQSKDCHITPFGNTEIPARWGSLYIDKDIPHKLLYFYYSIKDVGDYYIDYTNVHQKSITFHVVFPSKAALGFKIEDNSPICGEVYHYYLTSTGEPSHYLEEKDFLILLTKEQLKWYLKYIT